MSFFVCLFSVYYACPGCERKALTLMIRCAMLQLILTNLGFISLHMQTHAAVHALYSHWLA